MSELIPERLEQLRRELDEADALEASSSRIDHSKARWKRATWARKHGYSLIAEVERLRREQEALEEGDQHE